MTKPYGEDLTASHKDYAVFLPAVSGFYQTYVSKQQQTIGTKDQFVPDDRIPKGFENGVDLASSGWVCCLVWNFRHT